MTGVASPHGVASEFVVCIIQLSDYFNHGGDYCACQVLWQYFVVTDHYYQHSKYKYLKCFFLNVCKNLLWMDYYGDFIGLYSSPIYVKTDIKHVRIYKLFFFFKGMEYGMN